MKKILLILVLPFLICGFTNQEMAISNLKQCFTYFTEDNFSSAKQYCDKVLEIQKKGIIADLAYTMSTITQFSDEKELLNNLDKFERFPISYIVFAEYYYKKEDYAKTVFFYRKALKHKYNCNKMEELPLEENDIENAKKECNKFYTEAESKLGMLLIVTEDEKDIKEGLMYLEQASKKGDNTLLGLCKEYYYNNDYENTAKFCSPLVKNGNEDATLILAYMEYAEKHDEKVKKLLKPLLAKSNKEAKIISGLILIEDEDKNKQQQGIKLLEESVGQKNDKYYPWVVHGKYQLANIYYNGKGVNKDYEKAFNLLKEIEEADFLPHSFMNNIQVILGFMHFMGHGTPVNDKIAYEYWQKAYKAGNIGAISLIEYDEFKPYLALMFGFKDTDNAIAEYANWMHSGKGKKYLVKKEAEEMKKNIVPSLRWFAELADEGYDFANWHVGIHLFLYGEYDKAFEYLDRAGAMKKPAEEQKI